MHTHSTVDSAWRGVPTSFRYWLHTQSTEWNFEWSCRWRYLSIGFDIFDGDHDFSGHLGLPFLWLSLSLRLNWAWMKTFRRRFHARYHYGERSFFIRFCDASFSWGIFENDGHDNRRRDPWWKHGYIRMPWHREHIFTEILSPDLKTVAHREESGKRKPWPDGYNERQAIKEANSLSAAYTYVRKNGEVQKRIATYHVERMGHGFRWLRFPFFVRTSIWVDLDGEIGEGTGSWKGGTTGFGTTVLKGETPLSALRRMEATRIFGR